MNYSSCVIRNTTHIPPRIGRGAQPYLLSRPPGVLLQGECVFPAKHIVSAGNSFRVVSEKSDFYSDRMHLRFTVAPAVLPPHLSFWNITTPNYAPWESSPGFFPRRMCFSFVPQAATCQSGVRVAALQDKPSSAVSLLQDAETRPRIG
jgi:hypothetical protein